MAAFHLWTPPFRQGKTLGSLLGVVGCCHRSGLWMRQEDSRRPVWEFADRVQITQSVLQAQWKALVVPAPSRRLLRHTLLPIALTSSRSWSAYAAAAGVL
jgi:hypothetical protein